MYSQIQSDNQSRCVRTYKHVSMARGQNETPSETKATLYTEEPLTGRCIQALLSLPGRGHDYDLLTWTTVPESTSAGYNTKLSSFLRVNESPPHRFPGSHSFPGRGRFLTIGETTGSRSLSLSTWLLRNRRSSSRVVSFSSFPRLLSAARVARLIDSDLNARLIIRQPAPRSTDDALSLSLCVSLSWG